MRKWLIIVALFIMVGCAYQYSYQKTIVKSRVMKNPADSVAVKPEKKP